MRALRTLIRTFLATSLTALLAAACGSSTNFELADAGASGDSGDGGTRQGGAGGTQEAGAGANGGTGVASAGSSGASGSAGAGSGGATSGAGGCGPCPGVACGPPVQFVIVASDGVVADLEVTSPDVELDCRGNGSTTACQWNCESRNYYIAEGDYSIGLSAPGFASQTIEFKVSPPDPSTCGCCGCPCQVGFQGVVTLELEAEPAPGSECG